MTDTEQEPPTDMIDRLRESLEDLEARIALLEERLEVKQEPTPAPETEIEMVEENREDVMKGYSLCALLVLFFMMFTVADMNILFILFLLTMLFVRT